MPKYVLNDDVVYRKNNSSLAGNGKPQGDVHVLEEQEMLRSTMAKRLKIFYAVAIREESREVTCKKRKSTIPMLSINMIPDRWALRNDKDLARFAYSLPQAFR